MDFFHAVFLGAIQGITEFLPVSSSAHLAIYPKLLGFPYQGKEFDVFLNVGSLLAIIVFFRREFWSLIVGLVDFFTNKATNNRYFFITIFLSSLPTIVIFGIAELALNIDIKSPAILSTSMILFAVILFLCDLKPSQKTVATRKDSILTGIAQTMSLIPGVSRLGACLSMMRYLNYSRTEAFKYSMILSIPPVVGACSLKLLKIYLGKASVDWPMVAAGGVSAFVFGLISLALVSCFLKKFTLLPIVVYRILFGLFIAIYLCGF